MLYALCHIISRPSWADSERQAEFMPGGRTVRNQGGRLAGKHGQNYGHAYCTIVYQLLQLKPCLWATHLV